MSTMPTVPTSSTGDVRDRYAAAADVFIDLVGRIPVDHYDGPGLGTWDLRSLVGHTSRSLATVRDYLGRPAGPVTLATPADYLVAASSATAADPAAVEQRGRAAGVALGEDPGGRIRELAAEVRALLEGADLDAALPTVAGVMRVRDYLPTRVFELVVHCLDIAAATELQVSFPDDVLEEATSLAASTAVRAGRAPELLLALTGRRPLPAGFTII
jgi:Mycothiol maleylpyruvate isomerase N-terminal domain